MLKRGPLPINAPANQGQGNLGQGPRAVQRKIPQYVGGTKKDTIVYCWGSQHLESIYKNHKHNNNKIFIKYCPC